MSEQKLTGRTVWVTGAGSGMGQAAAVAVAASGATVILSGRRIDALAATADLVKEAGGEAITAPLDVSDREQIAAVYRDLTDRVGPVTDLVLSAGLNVPNRVWADQDVSQFESIVATNLTGVVAVLDAALPDLRRAGGQVVVISSYAGWRFVPYAGVAYSASKTALASICQSLNAQEAEHGVRACHLCPGDVATDFLDLRPNTPDADARAVMLTPADVAAAVNFVLTSPAHVRIDELVISPISQT